MSNSNLTLVTLGGAFGMRNVSPFCFKLELLMHHLGLDFTLEEDPDPRKAPKGKMPFLKTGAAVYADSEVIMAYLDELTQGKVYGGLSAQQNAYGLALTRLAEEHLYWVLVASRWLDDSWWPNVVDGFFHIAPAPVRPLVAGLARRQMRRTYDLQGLGRHSEDEERGFARRDLQALQDAAGPDGFLFGDEPCVYDFAIAAIMTGMLYNRPKTWLTPIAEEYTDLVAYTQRVQAHVGIYAADMARSAPAAASGTAPALSSAAG